MAKKKNSATFTGYLWLKTLRLRFFGIREIKIHVYRKQQTSDSSLEFLRIANKQIKTVPNDFYG